MSWTERARRFRDLHHEEAPFLLPSIEHVLGVGEIEKLGFRAAEQRSSRRVEGTLPVSAAVELEDAPGEVASKVRELVAFGFVGVLVEDAGEDIEHACARVRAAVDVSPELVVTVRSHVHRSGATLEASIERLKRFAEVGAHVFEAPALRRAEHIRRVVEALARPVNVTLGLGGVPPSLGVLGELGVARVSTGHVFDGFAREAVERAAREMLDHGTFEFLVELDS